MLTKEPADIHAMPKITSGEMDALAISITRQVMP